MARRQMGDVIVLIPGILGSVLERDGKDVWAPSAGATLGALWTLGRSVKDLVLHGDPYDQDDLGDGVVATRIMPDVHIVPGLWSIDGYSSISAMIRSNFDVVPGRTFIELPYDWRRDNRASARKLAKVALAALHEQRKDNPDAKLVLVAHSMGGLVARWFLECMDGWKDTRTLITFGTPYRGSLNAVDFIANGFVKKIGPFKIADLTNLMLSFTSVYQLLPIYPCIDQGGGELVRVADSSVVPHLDVERARAAEHDFHRVIESAVAARTQDAYVIQPIVGLSQPTRQSAVLQGGKLEVIESYRGEDLGGDGTVPRVSATPIELDGRPSDPAVYSPDRHGSLQNSPSVQAQVLGLLTPVVERERFRDARGALSLDLDDLWIAGEDIPVSVTADTRRLDLVATVIDLATRLPVAGPLPMTTTDDQFRHAVDVPPLPAGTYRVDVQPMGESVGSAQPVHGLIVVADDVEPG